MKKEVLVSSYNSEQKDKSYCLPYNYFADNLENINLLSTQTGRLDEMEVPITGFNDALFSELPVEIKQNVEIQPFLKELLSVYTRIKKEDYTYLPLLVGENDGENIILDWIYETVRVSFFFSKERDSYSLIKYDPHNNSYYQKIETLAKTRYKDIATEVVQAIG